MRKVLFFLGGLALFGGQSAYAQTTGGAGPFAAGQAGSNGFQINGLNALSFSTSAISRTIKIGPYAGASLVPTDQFVTAIGDAALESMIAPTSETVAIGDGAGIALTTGGGIVAVGVATCASQVTGGGTCIGNDAGRDMYEPSGNSPVLLGPGAYGDGAGGGGNIVIGTNAMYGAASTITFSGAAATLGDVKHFTVSSSNSCNGTTIVKNCTTGAPQVVNYTVVAGDVASQSTLATNVAAALSTALQGAQVINYTLGDGVQMSLHSQINMVFSVADGTYHPTVIKGHYPSNWLLSIAYTCTGTCGDTVTIAGPSAPSNNVITGDSALGYFGAGTTSNLVLYGDYILSLKAVGSANVAAVGNNIGLACQATCNNSAVFGNFALQQATQFSQSVVFGNYGGYGVTTGLYEFIVGDQTTAGSACITTGNNDSEVGNGACVVSPTASNQLSMFNIIYGAGNSGTGATLSAGCIGFYTTACTGASVLVATDLLTGNATALGLAATAGYFGFPTAAGITTGVPTFAGTGSANCVVDTTNGYLNCYYGAAWHKIAFAAGAG